MQFILRTIAIFVAVAVAAWLVPGINVIGQVQHGDQSLLLRS